jgi:hypothetical protein
MLAVGEGSASFSGAGGWLLIGVSVGSLMDA